VTVEIADLGAWTGMMLVAEYDPEADAIRVNARAVARIRAALGAQEAARFVICAVAHERFHRSHPAAGEAEAHAYAEATSGVDPRLLYESVLRGR